MALAVGLLVGFEREWSHKDLGARTFTITSLFGVLAALIAPAFTLVAAGGVIALIVLVNLGSLKAERPVETTTGAALLVTFSLGVLIGNGHVFTPAATAILMTLLLALKPQLVRFAGGLTQEEIRSAVLLGLIGFVIYPTLPNRFIDPWMILNPREAWLTVILIAAIGFLNYVLLRLYSTRGLYYSAVFGGLMNSTAAIARLIGPVAAAGPDARPMAVVINLLTIVAMFVRNVGLLLVFSPRAGLLAAVPISVMAFIAAWFMVGRTRVSVAMPEIEVGSPLAVRQLISFALLFVAIQAAASLGQRFFGHYGTVVVGALGGLASSASSTAVAGNLARHGQITPLVAAFSAVLASVASALINLPIVYRATKDRSLVRQLLLISLLSTGAGLAALAVLARFMNV